LDKTGTSRGIGELLAVIPEVGDLDLARVLPGQSAHSTKREPEGEGNQGVVGAARKDHWIGRELGFTYKLTSTDSTDRSTQFLIVPIQPVIAWNLPAQGSSHEPFASGPSVGALCFGCR
jgi:hypothetical protein